MRGCPRSVLLPLALLVKLGGQVDLVSDIAPVGAPAEEVEKDPDAVFFLHDP